MVIWQVHDVESQPPGDIHAAVGVTARVEQQELRTRHERRPDERFGAGIAVVAVHHDEAGPHAAQRSARSFVGFRKEWLVSGELDGGTEKGGRERIGG